MALTLLAFTVRLTWFCTVDQPLGTDGYYYVVQTRDLVSEGRLHVPDSSWVFALHALVGQLFAPIMTTKIVAAFLVAAAVPAAFASGPTPHSRWALGVWAACSPTLTHLAADFPKNAGVVAPWFVLLAATRLHGAQRWAVMTGALVLLATAHRTGMVWAVLAVGTLAMVQVGRRREGLLFLCGLGAVVLFMAPWVPGWLSLEDRFRLDGQLGFGAVAPFCWFSLRRFAWPEQLELIGAWGGLLAALSLGLWRSLRPADWMAVAWLLVVLAPVYDGTSLDLGYRLTLLAPLAAAPLLARSLEGAWRRVPASLAPATALLVGLAPSGVDPEELPPYERFDALVDAVPRPLPELLIAHQGINFLYDYRTRDEAMAWAPEPALDPHRVGRLVWGVTDAEWVALGDFPTRVRLSSTYSYASEHDWRGLVSAASSIDDDDLHARLNDWRNPRRVRPSALTRGRSPSRTRP